MGEPETHTIPSDARFHNCNATKWCFESFVDYHRCKRLLGDGDERCEEFYKIYRAICPNAWVQRWEDQIKIGTFPVDLPPYKNECKGDKK